MDKHRKLVLRGGVRRYTGCISSALCVRLQASTTFMLEPSQRRLLPHRTHALQETACCNPASFPLLAAVCMATMVSEQHCVQEAS